MRSIIRDAYDEAKIVTAAKEAYAAYNETGARRWLSWDGRPCPQWADLGEAIQDKWISAVMAAYHYGHSEGYDDAMLDMEDK